MPHSAIDLCRRIARYHRIRSVPLILEDDVECMDDTRDITQNGQELRRDGRRGRMGKGQRNPWKVVHKGRGSHGGSDGGAPTYRRRPRRLIPAY